MRQKKTFLQRTVTVSVQLTVTVSVTVSVPSLFLLAERAVGTRTLKTVPELPALRYARGLCIVPPDAHFRRAGLDIVGQHCRFAREMFPWTEVTPAASTVMHRDASRPRGQLWREMLDDGDCASKHRARRWGGSGKAAATGTSEL